MSYPIENKEVVGTLNKEIVNLGMIHADLSLAEFVCREGKMQTLWSDFKAEAIEMKKSIEREMMLRRFEKFTNGQTPWEEAALSAVTTARAYMLASWRKVVKRFLDITVAIIGLILSMPVIAVISILIKLESKGPAIYKQTRIGMRGKVFEMYKFRSMRSDAENTSGPVWATEDDPRVTRFGRFLRKTHLDEFPQLLNVLKGEMSVVGPRPERPYFVNQFRKIIPHYDRRHCAKPGITGLAQIKQRYDETIRDVQRKVRYDALYVKKMCPFLDMKVIALTALTVILKTGR